MKALLWGLAVLALCGAAWFARSEPALPAARVQAIAMPLAAPAPVEAPPAVPAPKAVQPQKEQPAPPRVADRALASAETTVSTQMTYLEDGQYDLFVQTFAEDVRSQVTRDVFERCRTRIGQVPVRPDWEMAEETAESGHRVRRVSMFGKSMTPFVETDGAWRAQAIWCLPVGLP
jgi:hypothetical protein